MRWILGYFVYRWLRGPYRREQRDPGALSAGTWVLAACILSALLLPLIVAFYTSPVMLSVPLMMEAVTITLCVLGVKEARR